MGLSGDFRLSTVCFDDLVVMGAEFTTIDTTGDPLGEAVGNPLGRSLGDPVGDPVGNAVGRLLGGEVGNAVGRLLGGEVGEAVGEAVGSEDRMLVNELLYELLNTVGSWVDAKSIAPKSIFPPTSSVDTFDFLLALVVDLLFFDAFITVGSDVALYSTIPSEVIGSSSALSSIPESSSDELNPIPSFLSFQMLSVRVTGVLDCFISGDFVNFLVPADFVAFVMGGSVLASEMIKVSVSSLLILSAKSGDATGESVSSLLTLESFNAKDGSTSSPLKLEVEPLDP